MIFVWLPGGPPHMETYDMKPDAPADYRGDFRPIKTNVPGIEVCELLPMHARCADKYTLVRSVHHTFADHGGGHKRFLTGRKPATPTGFVNDAPCVGSIASKLLEKRGNPSGLTNYIVTGNGRAFCAGADIKERAAQADDMAPQRTSRQISPTLRHLERLLREIGGEERRQRAVEGRHPRVRQAAADAGAGA